MEKSNNLGFLKALLGVPEMSLKLIRELGWRFGFAKDRSLMALFGNSYTGSSVALVTAASISYFGYRVLSAPSICGLRILESSSFDLQHRRTLDIVSQSMLDVGYFSTDAQAEFGGSGRTLTLNKMSIEEDTNLRVALAFCGVSFVEDFFRREERASEFYVIEELVSYLRMYSVNRKRSPALFQVLIRRAKDWFAQFAGETDGHEDAMIGSVLLALFPSNIEHIISTVDKGGHWSNEIDELVNWKRVFDGESVPVEIHEVENLGPIVLGVAQHVGKLLRGIGGAGFFILNTVAWAISWFLCFYWNNLQQMPWYLRYYVYYCDIYFAVYFILVTLHKFKVIEWCRLVGNCCRVVVPNSYLRYGQVFYTACEQLSSG